VAIKNILVLTVVKTDYYKIYIAMSLRKFVMRFRDKSEDMKSACLGEFRKIAKNGVE
jgi:hypothetical protein